MPIREQQLGIEGELITLIDHITLRVMFLYVILENFIYLSKNYERNAVIKLKEQACFNKRQL